MKVLVFGRSGQVATELGRLDAPDFAVTMLGRDNADLRDPQACAAAVRAAQADVVVNAAAWTAVDKAEEAEAAATVVNAEAPGAIAAACAAAKLPFLHISTDYVFNGSGDAPWVEDAPVAPLGAYGRSKLAGERAVAAAGGPHAILRTAWVFAGHGGNFVRTMLRVGATRDRLTVVDDQRGGPTWAGDIAAALAMMARTFHAGRGISGVYHFAGAPTVSWAEFAREVFVRAHALDAGWITPPDVVPIRTEDWPTPATRPRNSALDCAKIGRDYGIAQPDWRHGLDAALKEIRETAA